MIMYRYYLAKLLFAASLFYPQLSSANGFTSADVLQWSHRSQEAMFQTSVTMIGIVATQTGNHGHIARCIDQWTANGTEAARNDRIRDAMRRFPQHHPQAIILALVEKECGAF